MEHAVENEEGTFFVSDIRFKESSLAEHLAVQKAALEKKHRAELTEYQKKIQALTTELSAKTPQSAATNQMPTHLLDSLVARIKLERYQMVKAISGFMAETLASFELYLPKDAFCDLAERTSLEYLDKVSLKLSAVQAHLSVWHISRPTGCSSSKTFSDRTGGHPKNPNIESKREHRRHQEGLAIQVEKNAVERCQASSHDR